MRECDNSKIHISSNLLLSICLLIMLNTLLLVPSLHCNTSLHLTTLHQTTLHYTYRHHFLSFTFHYSPIWLNPSTFPIVLFWPPITKPDTVRFSHPQTYFQSNEPLHCPEELLSISLHLNLYLFFFHFTLLFASTTHIPSLPLPSLFTFYRLHFPCLHFLLFIVFTSPTLLHFPNPRFENMSFTVGNPDRPFR